MKQYIEIEKRPREEYENQLAANVARRNMEWLLDLGHYRYYTHVDPEYRCSYIYIYLDGKRKPQADEYTTPTKTTLVAHNVYNDNKHELYKYYTYEVRYDWE